MRLFVCLLIFLMLSGCTMPEWPFSGENNDTSLPLQETVEQPPLLLSYEASDFTDDELIIGFIAEHNDGSVISSDDYQFQWPSYITDEEDMPYEVTETEVTQNDFFNETLDDHEIGVLLHISPPPKKNGSSDYLHIPFYMIPSLFEDGYHFTIDEETERTTVGDLSIDHIETDGANVSFQFEDNHPEANRQQEYLFTVIEDDQNVYPMFMNDEYRDGHHAVDLEFANDLELPVRFSIERTTEDIPEWRFSFVIELEERENEEPS